MLKVAIMLLSPPKYLFSIEIEIWATVISLFQREIKIFGPNFSYLIFKAVNFSAFWGPAEMRGNDFEENTSITHFFSHDFLILWFVILGGCRILFDKLKFQIAQV